MFKLEQQCPVKSVYACRSWSSWSALPRFSTAESTVVAVISTKCFHDEAPRRRVDLSEEIARRRITFADLSRAVKRDSLAKHLAFSVDHSSLAFRFEKHFATITGIIVKQRYVIQRAAQTSFGTSCCWDLEWKWLVKEYHIDMKCGWYEMYLFSQRNF